jgi:nucleotide-binding universal stress UspA family protein
MQTPRPLVCGTDFSECAGQALELAVELASPAAAGITLVHVCELGALDLDDRRLWQCEEALSELVARHRRRRIDITGILRSGTPWTKLDNVAAEVGARLIVIGRHGAGRGRSVALGSVADRLVRSASRPVLTVPFDADRSGSSGAPPGYAAGRGCDVTDDSGGEPERGGRADGVFSRGIAST